MRGGVIVLGWLALLVRDVGSAQAADIPIIPQSGEGWWALVLRNWAPLGVGLYLLRMWINAEQERRHLTHETAIAAAEKKSADGLRDVGARIGLPDGQTVAYALNGVGGKVADVEKVTERLGERVQSLAEIVRTIADTNARLASDVGGVRALVSEMISTTNDARESIRADIHKSDLAAAERDAMMRERVARMERAPNMADVVRESFAKQNDALQEVARALAERNIRRDA